jgi:formate-dependent nitrite reductase membrane component NrfD
MKLVPKQWEEYNPVLVAVGAIFLFVGGYPLLMMPGPPIVWLIRGIFAMLVAMGSIILVRQFQLWKLRTGETKDSKTISDASSCGR